MSIPQPADKPDPEEKQRRVNEVLAKLGDQCQRGVDRVIGSRTDRPENGR